MSHLDYCALYKHSYILTYGCLVDDQSEIRLSFLQGTLLGQPISFGFIRRLIRWT